MIYPGIYFHIYLCYVKHLIYEKCITATHLEYVAVWFGCRVVFGLVTATAQGVTDVLAGLSASKVLVQLLLKGTQLTVVVLQEKRQK